MENKKLGTVEEFLDTDKPIAVLVGSRATWVFKDEDEIPYYMGLWDVIRVIDNAHAVILYVEETAEYEG